MEINYNDFIKELRNNIRVSANDNTLLQLIFIELVKLNKNIENIGKSNTCFEKVELEIPTKTETKKPTTKIK